MARIFTQNPKHPNWLGSGVDGHGVHVEIRLHDERYVEYRSYDFDNDERPWTITVIDRDNPMATITLTCEKNYQRVTTDAALSQMRRVSGVSLRAA
jgi:hypothetical protein